MTRRLLTVAMMALATAGLGAQAAVPMRVFATDTGASADLDRLAAAAAASDVVFVGEEHDDVDTHRVERQLLEAIRRQRADAVLALEMFERDVQEPLGHFLMGHIEESEFLAEARPWPEYARDYKPLVDFAIAQNWPVVAANVPRDIAADVATSGLGALDAPNLDKTLFARERQCEPAGPYFSRFRDAIGSHGVEGARTTDAAAIARYYEAQCLKDETMAESIAQSYAAGAIGGKRPLVISVNGAFHSDYRHGTVERTARRLPGRHLLVITIVPVKNIDAAAPEKDASQRADWIVYTASGAL